MKKTILALLLSGLMLLSGCAAGQPSRTTQAEFQAAATTYPVYLMAQAVTEGVEGVSVSLVIDQEVSCLHNYTLTMQDMRSVEQADVLLINGMGLEDFLDDVLENRTLIDCSQGITPREPEEDDGHNHGLESDHSHETDPHIWMDPRNAAVMAQNIAQGLAELDPDHAEAYLANAKAAAQELTEFREEMLELLDGGHYDLITFHDGFRYFAQALGLPLLASIEEEEGSEASAKEINEIAGLVKEYSLPVIFTEVNGSDATAQAIARETGCAVAQLSMCMDGPEEGTLSDYYTVLADNVTAVVNGFAGEEVIR